MRTATYNFRGYKARAKLSFTCACCGKPNRTRSITVEHTVNPFNKNPDGTVKTSLEVMRSASAEAKRKLDELSIEPWCASCENALSYAERKALSERRRAGQQVVA